MEDNPIIMGPYVSFRDQVDAAAVRIMASMVGSHKHEGLAWARLAHSAYYAAEAIVLECQKHRNEDIEKAQRRLSHE